MNSTRTPVTARLSARLASRGAAVRGDDGMTTAEYAVGTVAACGVGGVLYKVLTSDAILELISKVVLDGLKRFGL